ncbi:MAG: hypothetical protein HY819_17130 [Acidobacteria bacterium]|nr:hypothetical protein [Acidobacteriota bacterium]
MPFQVIFEGLKDNTPEQKELIKGKLVDKFKLAPEKAERMIVSAPIVVKKGLTQDQANKYKAALDSIGAIATVRLVPDETDAPIAQTPTPIAQAPIAAKTIDTPPAKAVEVQAPEIVPATIVEKIPEIKISETSPLSPLLFNQEKEPTAPTKPNPLESDYPIFYGEGSSEAESKSLPTQNDPYKTNAQSAFLGSSSQETSTVEQPASSASKTNRMNGEWWQTVQVLNPPFDEAAKSVTPITSGRISANEYGFSIAHPMIERIAFNDVQIISTCQVGVGSNPKLYIDIFISSTPRPIRLDLDLMNFASFGINRPDAPAERLASAVTALIERNSFVIIDLATYKLLKDKTKVKIVSTDRDIEKYCGKLQIEVDKGLNKETNSNIISCQKANELLDSPDPWASTPPLTPPSPQAFPGQGQFAPQFPMSAGQVMPPDAYSTQPVRPPNTTPGISQNPTQAAPPVRLPQAPPQNPPQPYAPPYLQQPPNNPAYPPPQQFNPQSNPYAPPQNRPFAPPQMADQKSQFPYPPMQGQNPATYQQSGFAAAPGQFPIAPPLGQYSNPTMSNEVNKAFEEANTALILSVVGFLCGCLSPLAIVGLIKAQNALKIFDKYRIDENRSKAVAAKIISIIALAVYAITLLSWIAR